MKKENILKNQILHIENILDTQIENAFSTKLEDLMSFSEMFDTREIYIIGSGDSYAAALAFAPLLEEYCDCFGVNVMDPLTFSRYLTKEDIGIGEPNNPLIIAISASGSPARIYEVLKKGNEIGGFTVILTGNDESRSAQEAKRVFKIETPKLDGGMVGLETYISSMLGLIGFTTRFGRVRGTLIPETKETWIKEIKEYFNMYMSDWKSIDETIKKFAEDNYLFDRYDFIGDHTQQASALFSSFTAVEAFGAISTVDDSENWTHINTFFKDPNSIPTIIVANKNSPSHSRILETIEQAKGMGRPILVIGDFEENIEGVTNCKLPSPNLGYDWLQPLFDCLPLALLSAYVTEFKKESYFRMPKEGNNDFFELQTIANSEVKIYK